MKTSKRVQRLLRLQNQKRHEEQTKAQVALGYVRVSTDEQAKKGHGLQAQEKAIRAFAESQGYELLGVIRDSGISGASEPAKREGFGGVIELAKADAFTILLVWKFDRLARSIVHAVTTANELRETHGVVLQSVTEPLDTASPMGQTVFAILAGMAQQERQSIVERTIAGKRAKAAKGGYAGATAPFGYRTDGHGHLVIEQSEAEVVRRMFKMREDGLTLKQIADKLNHEKTRTRRGSKWYASTVRYVLDNPRYKGKIEYFFRSQDEAPIIEKGQHEAIL